MTILKSSRSERVLLAPYAPSLALVLGALCCGCASSSAPRFPTVSELPSGPRIVPGIALDPPRSLPSPTSSGSSTSGVLVLREPAPLSAAKQLVTRFFRAVQREDEPSLAALFHAEATVQQGLGGARQSARGFWQTRLARLDYTALRGLALSSARELEVYPGADAAQLASDRRLPPFVTEEEVVVRARVLHTHAGRTRLFGDEIVFVLRPNGADYVIDMLIEDFALPQ